MDNECYFTEISLKNVENNEDLKSSQRTFLFRGQAESKWELETTLDRFLKNIPDADKPKVEPYLSEEFQRRYNHYAQNMPQQDNRIEWWALMQHFGAPTRLLDWTYSFFVALFFAIEEIEKNQESALWAIDADWLREQYGEMTKALIDDPHMSNLATFQIFDGKPTVLRLNPFHLHERLSVQQGCFLIPGNASISFCENLFKVSGGKNSLKEHLYKIIIPNSPEIRRKNLEALFRKNISRASLFPGLEGYARSLRTMTYSMPKLLNKPEFLQRMQKSWAWKG